MQPRIAIEQTQPDAYKAMLGIEKYLAATGLDPLLLDLIKLRASYINGCAYCIQMHTEDAVKRGETTRRLFAVAAWRDSPHFTPRERIIFQLTDEITNIADRGLTTETYNAALAELGEPTLAQVIMQIVQINSWNRIALATHKVHED